jgi:hypothetical protein
MTEKLTIETYGTILKKETIKTIEQDFSGNALVLESLFPFPGYYHNIIPETKELEPGSIYIVLKTLVSDEKLMRINHEIKKILKRKFDSAPGQINLFNEMKPCIRVKSLHSYQDIPLLIDMYRENEGIQFAKFRLIKPYSGLIIVKKFFIVDCVEEGIYKDTEDPDMGYIQIPGYLKWSNFEQITLSLKRNLDDNKFDAAIGTIHRRNSIVDMVRIYDKDIKTEKLQFIRNKYLEAIHKLEE